MEIGVSSLRVPGVKWHSQILEDPLTLPQPGGINYVHQLLLAPRLFKPSNGPGKHRSFADPSIKVAIWQIHYIKFLTGLFIKKGRSTSLKLPTNMFSLLCQNVPNLQNKTCLYFGELPPYTPIQKLHNRTDAVIHTMAATQLPRCWHTLHMWSFLGTVHFEQVKTEYICTCFRNITNQFLPQWWLLYKRHYKL